MAQTVLWRYLTPLVGQDLARMNAYLFEPCVLQGLGTESGAPVIKVGNALTFPPGSLLIYDSASINDQDACMVKIREDSNFSLSPTVGHRYVTARYTWTNTIDTAATYRSVVAPLAYDVILCSLEWDGTTLVGVDSVASGLSGVDRIATLYNNLRVVADTLTAMTVKVFPGNTYVAARRFSFGGGTLLVPTAVSQIRYDVIALSYNGSIVRNAGVEGAAAPTQTVPGQFALALLRVRVGATQILDSDIIDVRPFSAGVERLSRHIHIPDATSTYNIDIAVPGDQCISIAQATPGNSAPTIVFPSIPDDSSMPTNVEIYNGGSNPAPLTNVVDGYGNTVASVRQGKTLWVRATQNATGTMVWVADTPDPSVGASLTGASVAAFKWLYLDNTGVLQIADKALAATANVVGLALQTVGAGISCLHKLFGEVKGYSTGMTPGLPVYLGAAGGYTQDPTPAGIPAGQMHAEVGIAINATDIFVCIREPFMAGVLIIPTVSSALPNAAWIE